MSADGVVKFLMLASFLAFVVLWIIAHYTPINTAKLAVWALVASLGLAQVTAFRQELKDRRDK